MNDKNLLPGSSIWRSTGVWLALAMGLLQALYAIQSLADPAAFAGYRGMSLLADGDVGWVHTYASRTLFVAATIGYLIARRDLITLRWIALLGLVMPISDAIIASNAGAPFSIVARHLATILFLIVTFLALRIPPRHPRRP